MRIMKFIPCGPIIFGAYLSKQYCLLNSLVYLFLYDKIVNKLSRSAFIRYKTHKIEYKSKTLLS